MRGSTDMIDLNVKPEEAIDRLKTLVDKHVSPERTKGLFHLMSEVNDFKNAPASSKPKFHGCYQHGLVHHTLYVTVHMLLYNDMWKCDIPNESMVVAGIIHDLSKGGLDNERPYYTTETWKWVKERGKWKKEEGLFYKSNNDLPSMDQNTMSLKICQDHGFELTDQEYEAILGQDGMYSNASKVVWEGYRDPCTLSFIMHHADIFVAHQIKI